MATRVVESRASIPVVTKKTSGNRGWSTSEFSLPEDKRYKATIRPQKWRKLKNIVDVACHTSYFETHLAPSSRVLRMPQHLVQLPHQRF